MERIKRKPTLLLELAGRHQAKQESPHRVPPGPYIRTAELPTTPEGIAELHERFYRVMENLTYKEAMAWCRAMNRKYATYLMRRYRHRAPRLEEVIITCAWAEQGKPVTKKSSHGKGTFAGLVATFRSGAKYMEQKKALELLGNGDDDTK